MIEKRICKKCKIEKPINDFTFYIDLNGRRKQRYECKKCRAKYALEKYHEKRDKKCPICGEIKQPYKFVRNNSLDFKAYGKICRECAYKKNKELRKPKKEKYIRTQKNKNSEYVKRYRETKKYFIGLFGNKCAICGKTFPWYAYDFHHKNSQDKEAKISKFMKFSLKHLSNLPEFQEEIKKCILVCAICHRKLHLNGGE